MQDRLSPGYGIHKGHLEYGRDKDALESHRIV